MKTIQLTYSLEWFKSRLPSVYPSYDGNELLFFDEESIKKRDNRLMSNYGTVPLDICIYPKRLGYDGLDDKFPKEELSLLNDNDRKEMMKGIEREKKNAQDYIPLYAVYDFKNKEYVYVFDKRYVTVNDGVASINLFELKLRDESNDSTYLNDIKSYGIDSIF